MKDIKSRTLLMILDGWGINPTGHGDAIRAAKAPVFARLNSENPYVLIDASGEAVGLPAGQMGNSEVGHLNIGAGRVMYQNLPRISRDIKDGSFFKIPTLKQAFAAVRSNRSALHLLGLVSDGGVHSHIEHLFALIDAAKREGIHKLHVHAVLDGRDTQPASALNYIRPLEEKLRETGFAPIATVTGRYYVMDRDSRWERVTRGYNAVVRGLGRKVKSAEEGVTQSYAANVMDEFVEPCVITENGEPSAVAGRGDVYIMFNFRSDRMREICAAIGDPAFNKFDTGPDKPRVDIYCMTEYDENFPYPVIYRSEKPRDTFGDYLGQLGLRQFRTAETEKYAHVTFFFNGGEEMPYPGEDRKLIPSPKVASYDLMPEMSALEVTQAVIGALAADYHVVIVNIANGDMVGHTGVFDAAVKAVEVVDDCVGKILAEAQSRGFTVIITADHGNIESMIDDSGNPVTSHTTNLVPFYVVAAGKKFVLRTGGRLADIAPTLLDIMGLDQPAEMTGRSLIESVSDTGG